MNAPLPAYLIEKRRSVGAAIRAARITAGLSQRAVASRLGFSAAMMCMVENGVKPCPPARAAQVAAALAMPPDHLIQPPHFARTDDESELLNRFRHLPEADRRALMELARS